MSKFFYTYVLKSLKNNEFYIGWTDDLISRISKHNKGLVLATKSKLPFRLVYYEPVCQKKQLSKEKNHLKQDLEEAI